MPVFEYKGLNKQGRNTKGVVDADSLRAAKTKLKRDGVFVTDIKDKTKSAKKAKGTGAVQTGRVSIDDLSMMTRQLATLIKANIPLVDSLAAVSEQVENETLATIMAEMRNFVNEGGAFYKGLLKYPKIFDTIYVSMVEAGEMSGSLDVILIRLAEFKESQSDMNARVKSALFYPVMMLVVTILVLGILFVFVIPKITEVFESTPELKMPWYSEIVIAISGFMVNYWMVILGSMVGITLLFLNWKRTPAGRAQWDQIFLQLPVVGKLGRIIAVSRFTRTLSTLLNGGVPMLTAMSIVRNVVDNETIAKAIDVARENISEGESIAGPLKKSGQFPPIVIHMINIGEKTGELENMLTQVSDAYDFQVKNAVDGLTSLLAPVMIIVMGCVIGIIVFAVMVPMFELSSLGG
ncbi:MAG: type II secretion system protein GspF [Bdellovibrionaceae bacterium]|nr:type II secretion system protein GspF [Pseudobdellovibrionaceae bacterium]|tara:strand:+ start:1772 stop:2992 length:1221 start_codon:yes stop_codon:yes gene_type:complete